MNWLANLHATQHRSLAVLAAVLTLLASVGLVQVEFDNDPRAAFRVQDAAYLELEDFYDQFGADDQDLLLAIEGADLFDAPSLAAVRAVVDQTRALSGVESVVSLFDVRKSGPVPLPLMPAADASPERLERARREALSHPAAVGQLISPDARTMLVSVRLAGRNPPVSQLAEWVDKIRTIGEKNLAPADLRMRLAGHPSVRVDLLQTLRAEVTKFAVLGLIVSALIALAVFRSPVATIVASAGPAAGVLWTLGAMGWLGVKIDPLSVVLPTLLFVVGFTDAVHLIADIRLSRAAGESPQESASAAVRHLGPACLLTALTTMAGFGSLMAARTDCIQRFGATCACGAFVMFAAVQLVVPLLAATRFGGGLRPSEQSGDAMRVTFLQPAYRRLLSAPRLVAFLSVLVTLGCFLTSLRLDSDLQWTETLPRDSETVGVTVHMDQAFGGSMFAYLVVNWPEGLNLRSDRVLDVLRQVHKTCDASTVVRGPMSVLTLLESISRPGERPSRQVRHLRRMPEHQLRRFVRDDLGKVVVAVHCPDVGAAKLAPEFARLDDELKELQRKNPGFKMHLTGTVVVAARNVYQMIEDLGRSLALASGIIFVMMTVLFRSLFLGLMSVVPNVFPQAIIASLLVWIGEPLRLTTVLTFSLCLGLSVDDTVHFLMRLLVERRRGLDLRDAILATFDAVGGVMITTSLILMGGFLTMLVSQMPGVRYFALLSAITMLAAMLGDLVMLPAMLLCFPGRFARRNGPT